MGASKISSGFRVAGGAFVFFFLALSFSSLVFCAPDFSDVRWVMEVFINRELKSDEAQKLQSGWGSRDSNDAKVFDTLLSCMKKEKEDAEKSNTWTEKKESLKMKCFASGFRRLPETMQDGRNLPPFLKVFFSVLEKARTGAPSAKKK